jgi:lipopolysaccharide transport system permease protein
MCYELYCFFLIDFPGLISFTPTRMNAGDHHQIVEYTPNSDLRDLKKLGRRMSRDLASSFELSRFLFLRNINSQYRRSYLGFFWAVIPMLATATAFILLQRHGVFQVEQMQMPYAVFVIAGVLLWQIFLDSIQTVLRMLESSKPMLMKLNFPREALLLSALYEVCFYAVLRVSLVFVVALVFGISFSTKSILAVLGLMSLVGFGFTIGLFFAPLALLYQDLSRALNVFSLFWMFATPVLYPFPQDGLISQIVRWNPVAPLLDATRSWLMLGSTSEWSAFWTITCAWIVIVPIGWVFFRISLSHNIARMGM